MPNRIPDFQIANFLTTNTTALQLTQLSAAGVESECSICHNSYADPPQNYVHPDLPEGEDEYPVQIRNRGSCKHVFGRRCLEHHIRGGNPWSHTCPMCRTEWFPAPNAARRQMLNEVEWTLNHLATLHVDDDRARRELGEAEIALERIREALYESRWI
ncbi:hypothetical protein M3J09_003964 [Ascochyta lentis]